MKENKINLLFLTKYLNLIEAIKEKLGIKGYDWRITTCSNEKEGLKLLSMDEYDGIIADAHINHVSGCKFLNKIRRIYPRAIRILIDDEFNIEESAKNFTVAHQFLPYPFPPEQLLDVIQRAYQLRYYLKQERIKFLTNKLQFVPSLPSLYFELIQALRNSEINLDRLVEIIEKDMGVASKLLHIVNSAYFGIPRYVTNLRETITILGLNMLKSLILVSHIFTQLDQKTIQFLPVESLWQHSQWTGLLAQKIAITENMGQNITDYCYIGGLLHKIGIVILATQFPKEYKEVFKSFKEKKIPLHESEINKFGSSHAEVGGNLLSLWGIADPIVEAVAFHITPNAYDFHNVIPIAATHIGNYLASKSIEQNPWDSISTIDEVYLRKLNLYKKFNDWCSWLPVKSFTR